MRFLPHYGGWGCYCRILLICPDTGMECHVIQQVPPLLAMYSATVFPPSAHPSASVGSHIAADIRAFLQEPAYPTLPYWAQTVLRGIWPLFASCGSLSAWVMTDHHTLAGYNDPRSVKEPHWEL